MQTQETSGRLFGPDGKALTPLLFGRTVAADVTPVTIIPAAGSGLTARVLAIAVRSGATSTTFSLSNIFSFQGQDSLTVTLAANSDYTLPYCPHGWLQTDDNSPIQITNGVNVDTTEGPSAPGTAANSALDGTVAWANPNNIKVDDTNYATNTSATGSDFSQYLLATNFGFSVIPDAAQVTRIVVTVKRKAVTLVSGTIVDFHAALFTAGATVTNDSNNVNPWSTTQETITYDSNNGDWSLGGVNGAQVKGATFGFGLACQFTAPIATVAGVQFVQIAIHWNTPTGSAVEVCGVYVNRAN